MEGPVVILLLALLAVPIIRWLVWRSRYDALRKRLSDLETQIKYLAQRLNDLVLVVQDLPAVKRPKTAAAKSLAPKTVKSKATAQPAPTIRSEPLPSPLHTETEVQAPGPKTGTKKKTVAPPLSPTHLHLPTHARAAPKDEKPTAEWGSETEIEAAAEHKAKAGWHYTSADTIENRAGKALGRLFRGGKDQAADWETIVGGHWLNLVGIVVLVIGMILLTQQTLLYLGPEGKIATGLATGLALLIAGVGIGKWSVYRLFARTLMGGGWALLYFTAYAAHNVEQAKIIESPVIALVFLGCVAAGIIAHSFTYKSQLLTSLAYGLGFLAVTMSPVTIYSLVASLVLAASLVVVLRVLSWHHLVMVGVIGTYFNHWRWASEASAMWAAADSPTATISEDFWLGTAIVVMYWVLFVVASMARQPSTRDERAVHFATNLLNTVGMLGLIGWQTWQFRHGQIYYLTAPATIAYMCVAYLDRRLTQRDLFLFNETVAVGLFTISLPLALKDFELTKDPLAFYWATGAIIVLFAGVRLNELFIRIQSYLLMAIASLAAWQFNLGGEFTERSPALWPIVPFVIVLLTGVDEWLQRVRGQKGIHPAALELSWALAIVATALLARLVWNLVEPGEVGLIWLLIGLALLEIGLATRRPLMRAQGYLLVGAGTLAVLVLNLAEFTIPEAAPLSELVLTNWQLCLAAAATLYYWAWRMFRCAERLGPAENGFIFAPSIAATAILASLIFREVDWSALSASWMVLGLILYAVGWRSRVFYLRVEAYALSLIAFAAAVAINIYELQPPSDDYGIPDWSMAGFVTVGLAYIYLTARGTTSVIAGILPDRNIALSASCGATLLVSLILWKEFPSVAVAVAWAALSLVLFEVSKKYGLQILRDQSHLLMLAVFGRVFMANFTILEEALGLSHRLLSVTAIIAAIYYLRLRILEELPQASEVTPNKIGMKGSSIFISQIYSYAGAILIAVLMRFELGRAYAVLGWSAALLVFLWLGTRYNEFDFRIQSYVLAILAFARSWATSVYLLGSFYGVPERLVTTMPVIAAFFAATFMTPRKAAVQLASGDAVYMRWALYMDFMSRKLFALLASALVPILIFYQLPIDYVSMGWAIAGMGLLGIGFVANERTFRLCGLTVLFLTLGKVALFDLAGVETIYRILSFIVLGVILLLASLAYTRYRETLQRYL